MLLRTAKGKLKGVFASELRPLRLQAKLSLDHG